MSQSQVNLIRSCSIWRALEVLGDEPILLIVQSYWFGARRFDEFQRRTNLLKTVVSNRLQKLVAVGCFNKVQYQDRPVRFEYRGTQKLFDVFKIALAMLYWEKNFGSNNKQLNITLVHKTCGSTTRPMPACKHCHTVIDARQIDWAEGPGVGYMLPSHTRRRRQSSAVKARVNRAMLLDEAIGILGDRSAVLILRAIFTGLRKYKEIQEDSQLATNILAERLTLLARDKVIEKTETPDGGARSVYKLTEKGIALYPILVLLMEWGDKYYASPEGSPLLLKHTPCGEELEPVMLCSACALPVEVGEIEFKLHEGLPQPG